MIASAGLMRRRESVQQAAQADTATFIEENAKMQRAREIECLELGRRASAVARTLHVGRPGHRADRRGFAAMGARQ